MKRSEMKDDKGDEAEKAAQTPVDIRRNDFNAKGGGCTRQVGGDKAEAGGL